MDRVSRKPDILPILLFLTAFTLYFSLIGKGSYHPDTLALLDRVEKTLETGQLQGWLTGYNLPVLAGVFFVRLAEWMGFQDHFVSLNFMSVFFGSMSIPVFFVFCRYWWGGRIAFFSSVLLMFSPAFFSLSTFANAHIPAIFFLFLGLFFLSRCRDGGRIVYLLLSCIALGLFGASRPQELVFMALPLTFFMAFVFRSDLTLFAFLKILFFFWSGVVLFVFVFPLPFLSYDHPLWPQIKGLYSAYPSNEPTDMAHVMPMLKWAIDALVDLLSPLAGLFSLWGAFIVLREKRMDYYFLVLWFLCGFLFYAVIFHKIMPAGRYLLLAIVPLLIFAGHAFSRVCSYRRKIFVWIGGVLFFFVVFLFIHRVLPPVSMRHFEAINNDFSRWVISHTEKNALIFCRQEQPFIARSDGRRTEIPPYFLFGEIPAVREDLEGSEDFFKWIERRYAWIDERLAASEPVYILIPHGCVDDEDVFVIFLQKKYRLDLVGDEIFESWGHSLANLAAFKNKLFRIAIR